MERNRIEWLTAEVCILRGIRRNMGTGISPSRAGENDVKIVLLGCTEKIKCRMEFISKYSWI
jgi:hypothetical protein